MLIARAAELIKGFANYGNPIDIALQRLFRREGEMTWHHQHGKSPASITRRAAATSSVPASSHNYKPGRAKARAPSR